MTLPDAPDTLDDAEIDRRFRQAGVIVPADRAAGTYAVARRLLANLHRLREPRAAAAEPAHTFSPGRVPT